MEKIRLSDTASVKFLDGGFMEITVSPGVGPGLVELPARETELLRNALNKRRCPCIEHDVHEEIANAELRPEDITAQW